MNFGDDDVAGFQPIRRKQRHGAHILKDIKEHPRCGRKHSYSKNAAMDARARGLSNGVPYLRVYRCDKCSYWHLTSKQPLKRA